MNKKLYLFGMLAMVLLLASCKKEKETGSDPFNISAGIENDGSKTLLDGFKVKWILGDKIRIYDGTSQDGVVFTSKTLSNDDQTANFTCNASESIAESGSYWAIYPETGSYNRGTGLFSFNMPNTQTYHSNNTPMLFPMVATASKNAKGSGVFFYFQHAFGVLKISATGNTPITSIELTDANNYLSGNFTVRPDASTLNHVSGGSKTITMSVSNVTLTSTPTDFYFVLPAGSLSNGFTVKFLNNSGEVKTTSYPGTALEIIKATIHTATVDATKVHAFTVNADGKKVIFAPGNLCSDMGGGNWRFQPNQWTQTAVENGVRGMFYFSNNVTNNNGGINWTGDGTEYVNWGDMLPSSLGTGWYLLSDEEWYHLLYTRSGASSKYRAATTVNGIRGLVIVPDDWTGGISSSYSGSSWTTAESNGAVFLPRSGGGMQYNVNGNTLWPHSYDMYMFEGWQNGTTKHGQYWMVTAHPTWWDTNPRYHSVLYFNINSENGTNDVSVERTGCGGQSMLRAVRLVKDAN